MIRHHSTPFAVAAAWLTVTALGAQTDPPARPPTVRPGERDTTIAPANRTLVKSGAILGSEVHDRNNEKSGSIKDIGVDTKTGDMVFVIVSSGGVLGIGDAERVVAFNGVTCDAENKKCTLMLSKAELEMAPTWDAKIIDDYHRRFAKATKDSGAMKPGDAGKKAADAGHIKGGTDRCIKGKVVTVERVGDAVILDIDEDAKPENCRVSLGADTQLKSHNLEPKAGDMIEIWVADTASTRPLTARAIKLENKEIVHLGDATGQPCCALLSKIDDARVVCDGEKVGSVGDLLCDTQSSTVAFFTLSTSDFGERAEYLIPWRATWVDKDNGVHLRLSKAQMRKAPSMSKDSVWSDPTYLRRVDEFYITDTGLRVSPSGSRQEPVKKER